MKFLLDKILSIKMRTKISLTIFFIILLFSFGVTLAIRGVVFEKTNYMIENSIKNLVKVNESIVLKRFLEDNYWDIFKIMHSLKKIDLIKNATFVNKNYEVVASSEPNIYPIDSKVEFDRFDKSLLIMPLKSENLVFGYFIIQKEFGFLNSLMKNIRDHLLFFILIAALVSALIGYLISIRIVGRLELLYQNAKMIESGDWGEIRYKKSLEKDEITELSTVLNNMLKKIKEMIVSEQEMKFFYHNILENLDELVIICDKNFKIKYHNSNRLKSLIIKKDTLNDKNIKIIKDKIYQQDESFVVKMLNEKEKTMYLHVNMKNISDDITLSFSNITSIKKLEEQVLFKNSFEIVGEISAEVVHEIKNYLQPIRILLEQDNVDKQDKQRVLSIILKINNLVQNFLKSGRPVDKTLLVKLDIKEKIDSLLFLHSQKFEEKNIELLKDIDDSAMLYMAELDFSSIMTNLVTNAIDACEINGQIQIKCKQIEDNIILQIQNTGEEIDKDIIKKIHKPFFTTKKDGSGIGLYIVFKTVYLYGGFINIESNSKITQFSINLPVQEK